MANNQIENENQRNDLTSLANRIRFYLLWIFANSLVLTIGFLILSFLSISSATNLSIGYTLPMDQRGVVIMESALGITQALFLIKFPRRRKIVWWIIATIIGSETIFYLRTLTYFLFALGDIYDPDNPVLAILRTELGRYDAIGAEVFKVRMGFNQGWVQV